MLSWIGLALVLAGPALYLALLDQPLLRSTGALMFAVSGIGMVASWIALRRPSRMRWVGAAVSTVLVGALVYGFFVWAKLPEATSLRNAPSIADFTLPDHTGKPVALASLRAKGPVHLVFYRGHW